jgi:hypothetical protein
MKTSPVVVLVFAFAALFAPAFVTPAQANVEVPKYNPTTEVVFKGTVEEVRDRQCAVSGGMGSSHVILMNDAGTTIEVRSAPTEFFKPYELSPSSFACDKAADHTFPRRQPGSDRRRDNHPQNAPASGPRRRDVGSGGPAATCISPKVH